MSPAGVPPTAAVTTSSTKPGWVSTKFGSTAAATTSVANIARYPTEKTRYPTSPSTPACRCWRRYIPAMPASASTVITALALLRATQAEVSVVNESVGGWPTWTRTKMAPAATAAAPAALVRALLEICMTAPGVLSRPGGCPAMSRTVGTGVVTAHHIVM